MNLCRIDPDDIYHWFMEMFIDSSMVMVPNVYGMELLLMEEYFPRNLIYVVLDILRMSNYKRVTGVHC